jgi:hypothetical protein
MIIISFWSISPLISMECPSVSHLINVGLKSTLPEISIATPVLINHLPAFHPKPMPISVSEMGLL